MEPTEIPYRCTIRYVILGGLDLLKEQMFSNLRSATCPADTSSPVGIGLALSFIILGLLALAVASFAPSLAYATRNVSGGTILGGCATLVTVSVSYVVFKIFKAIRMSLSRACLRGWQLSTGQRQPFQRNL